MAGFESFPPSGVDFTSAQWAEYTRTRDGIMAEGPNTFTVGLSSVDDTATIHCSTDTTVANRVLVGGFMGSMTSDQTVTLAPAVGSPVTYHIGFQCDPADYDDPDGPVTIVSFTGSFDASGGKSFTGISDVTRSPSQTLNLATKVDRRSFLAPSISVTTQTALPTPTRCLFQTTAYVQDTGDLWQVQFTGVSNARNWEPIGNPDAIDFPLNGPLSGVPGRQAPRYRQQGSRVEAYGGVRRTSGFLNTGNDVALGQFPSGSRPSGEREVPMPTATSAGWRMCVGRVQADGWLYLIDSSIPTGTNVSLVTLDNVAFRAEQ